jgi:hypothetical protein
VIGIDFSKEFATKVLDAIKAGQPIPTPPGRGWTPNDMVTVAGVLYAAIFSHGPHTYQEAGIPTSEFKKTHSEHIKAVDGLSKDLHCAIEFISNLAFEVMDGTYDANCEPDVKAIIHTTEQGKTFTPIKGFKGKRDLV